MYITCISLLQIVLDHGVDIETNTLLAVLILYMYIEWIATNSCTPNKAECYEIVLNHYMDRLSWQFMLWSQQGCWGSSQYKDVVLTV